MEKVALVLASVLCLISSGIAENSSADVETDSRATILEVFTRIATASNANLCLDQMVGRASITSCHGGTGAPEWSWPPRNAEKKGPLSSRGLSGVDECLQEDLTVKACQSSSTHWSWNETSKQIYVGDKCLAKGSLMKLELQDCTVPGVATMANQAKQTWILETLESPEEIMVHKCRDIACFQRKLPKWAAWTKDGATNLTVWQRVGLGLAALCLLCCCRNCCCKPTQQPLGLPPPPAQPWAEARNPSFDDYNEDILPDLWCCSSNGPICTGTAFGGQNNSAAQQPFNMYSSLAHSEDQSGLDVENRNG